MLPRAMSMMSATHAEAVASLPAPRPCEKTGPTKSPIVKRPFRTCGASAVGTWVYGCIVYIGKHGREEVRRGERQVYMGSESRVE